MRGDGMVYRRGAIFWIRYYKNGAPFSESSHSRDEKAAKRLLRKRLGEIATGHFVGPSAERLTFEQMASDLVADYTINGRRALKSLPYWLAHLRRYFGYDRAVNITVDRVRAYAASRQKDGAANGTINRELTALKRMFSLAVQAGRLNSTPYIRLLEEHNVRQGFLDPPDFTRLRDALPVYLKDAITFLYLTAWRKGEMRSLEWRDVDLEGCAIRLRSENSKNHHGRVVKLTGELLSIIARAHNDRRPDCPFVFHDGGTSIGDFRKAWRNACKVAGFNGLLVHDLRRSGVRNAIRAGVPERVAMALSGHRTASMLHRYNIVSEGDLDIAAEKIDLYVEHRQGEPVKVAVLPGRVAA
jgi:integrase